MGMITRKFCPRCGSEDMMLAAGGTMGTWACKKCGYIGVALEKEFVGKEHKEKKKK